MSRVIVCADAVEWMKENRGAGAVVTSLPDAEEIGASIHEWERWFVGAARLSIATAADSSPAIFYQTDRKHGGETHSKMALLVRAAEGERVRMLWHKIVLRREVGRVDLHRPGFTHLVAFSRAAKPGAATADIMRRGKMIYPNAMGVIPALFAVRYAGDRSRVVIDPFCGRGTVPAIADALGYDAIGVDIDAEQCRRAEGLEIKVGGVSA